MFGLGSLVLPLWFWVFGLGFKEQKPKTKDRLFFILHPSTFILSRMLCGASATHPLTRVVLTGRHPFRVLLWCVGHPPADAGGTDRPSSFPVCCCSASATHPLTRVVLTGRHPFPCAVVRQRVGGRTSGGA